MAIMKFSIVMDYSIIPMRVGMLRLNQSLVRLWMNVKVMVVNDGGCNMQGINQVDGMHLNRVGG